MFRSLTVGLFETAGFPSCFLACSNQLADWITPCRFFFRRAHSGPENVNVVAHTGRTARPCLADNRAC